MRIQIRPDSKYLAGFKPETETWIRFRPLVSINNFLHEGHEDHWGLVKGGGGEEVVGADYVMGEEEGAANDYMADEPPKSKEESASASESERGTCTRAVT